MDCSIDETLKYISFLCRRVRPGDIPRAVTILLIEMSFEVHFDGFEYLKEAICLKCRNLKLQLSGIFDQIISDNRGQVDNRQLEQTIRRCIERAWALRKENVWQMLLPERLWKKARPSNFAFIARIAYLMDFWNNCSTEISTDIS